jgi:hypothetical protein
VLVIRGKYPYLPSNIRICPQISVFALVYPYFPPYSTSGICAVVSKIICQRTRTDDCHNLFITYFTLNFSKHFQTNCENKSLIELPLFNLQIFLFRIWFQKYTIIINGQNSINSLLQNIYDLSQLVRQLYS